MSKKISKLIVVISFLTMSFSVLIANADQSALIPSFWSAAPTKLVGNCKIRNEYNPYTNQNTQNEVCDPHVVNVNTNTYNYAPSNFGNTTYGPSYSTGYSGGYNTGYAPAYSSNAYYPTTSGLAFYGGGYYTDSSLNGGYWNTPANAWGYNDESFFNEYYRGGPSDYSGYYQPGYDTYPGDLGGVQYQGGNFSDTSSLYGSGNYFGGGTISENETVGDASSYQNSYSENSY